MRSLTTPRRLLPALLLLLAAAGCSDDGEVDPGPLTVEKIAAIARDHAPEPTREAPAEADGSDPKDAVGARLGYGDHYVDVVVGSGRIPVREACTVSECVEIGTEVEDATLTLVWQELVPEEDPGVIVLVLQRDDEVSLVRYGGDVEVTADPRDLELAVPVDDAVALLEDERLRLDVPAT